MRTTIDIDAPILKDLKRLQKREGKTLGRLVSDLLAEALARHQGPRPPRREFSWTSQPMEAVVDIADKDAVYAILDGPPE